MIAITTETRRMMYAKCVTETYTSGTYSSSNTSGAYVAVVADNGWQEVTVDDIAEIKIKEPVQEQDEPNTDEMSAIWERPHRRPATVNRAGRKTYPRRRSPHLGASGRQWSRHKTA